VRLYQIGMWEPKDRRTEQKKKAAISIRDRD
jgi:hypothetical protein